MALDMHAKNWKSSSDYKRVIEPLVAELKKRGRKVAVGKGGYWRYELGITIDDGPSVTVSVKDSNRRTKDPATGRRFGPGTRPLLFVMVGTTTWRGIEATRFPEPAAGFDFTKMADAVEQWRQRQIERDAQKKTAEERNRKWRKELKALPKELRGYNVDVSGHGEFVEVTLIMTTIEQVRRVLKVARAEGVKS